jgi:hypothetical protein
MSSFLNKWKDLDVINVKLKGPIDAFSLYNIHTFQFNETLFTQDKAVRTRTTPKMDNILEM